MTNKKAQGLSITTIILALLALVVLVVLITIFVRKTGKFGTETEALGNLEQYKNVGESCTYKSGTETKTGFCSESCKTTAPITVQSCSSGKCCIS